MFVDVEKLRAWEACDEQIALFERLYPHGAEVTEQEMRKAQKAGLYVSWLDHLLRDPGLCDEWALQESEIWTQCRAASKEAGTDWETFCRAHEDQVAEMTIRLVLRQIELDRKQEAYEAGLQVPAT